MRGTRPLHAPPTKVAILGAGRGGTALLDLLHQIPAIDIVGISDRDPRAPGLQRARDLHIPVVDQIDDLLQNHHTQLVLDVTGDPTMDQRLRREVRSGVDVLSGSASRVVWELVQHESALQAELLHAEKLAGIGSFAAGIAHDINNPLQLILGLAENLAEETDLHTVHEQAREIIDAVKRTTAICRDLTSYARRSAAHQQSLVDLNTKPDDACNSANDAIGTATLTAANGEQVWLTYTQAASGVTILKPSPLPVIVRFEVPFSVIGGTGRFASSGGDGVVVCVRTTPVSSASFPVHVPAYTNYHECSIDGLVSNVDG